MDAVDILGVRVACLDQVGMFDLLAGWLPAGPEPASQPRTIFYANAHCLNLAWEDAAYREILNQADLVYADGEGAAWAGRLLHGARMPKMTGADWIEPFCQRAAREGWGVYLLGGRPGVAQQAGLSLQKFEPALRIVGSSSGYFAAEDQAGLLEAIRQARSQVLLVGLGSPRQEKWIAENRAAIAAPVCWAVGALFDYLAGMELRAPQWMNANGLEWLWRLSRDPLGKWRRYLVGNPLFASRVLRQYWRGRA